MTKIENYENAYAEVIEVLNYIPIDEYKKIPKKYITFMEENCSEDCSFVYNMALPFNEQNISDISKNILGMLFRLFIIDQSKIEELNNKDQERKKKEEIEGSIKFISDNLIKNENKPPQAIEEKSPEEVVLIEYKESILKRIVKQILSLFKK